MSLAQTILVLGFAVLGGAGSYAVWALLLSRRAKPSPAAPATAQKPSALDPVSDPALAKELTALRRDVQTLAEGQIMMIRDRAERENSFLGEMRAIAATPDPGILAALARIEAALGIDPPAPLIETPEPDDEPPPATAPDLDGDDPPAPPRVEWRIDVDTPEPADTAPPLSQAAVFPQPSLARGGG